MVECRHAGGWSGTGRVVIMQREHTGNNGVWKAIRQDGQQQERVASTECRECGSVYHTYNFTVITTLDGTGDRTVLLMSN